jgi:glycosyltransferase A (GT-A) superfamily protein (DUF2064 family)
MHTNSCLVLMFKAPQYSKRRLAAAIGARARTVAEHLFDCAAADLEAWQGPTCMAPAKTSDLQFVRERRCHADVYVDQGDGNLGDRIERVNQSLIDAGYNQQLFIGTDCPALDAHYLAHADRLLLNADVVLGPAHDGGVVLMGIRGPWPPLSHLPWSTTGLRSALIEVCERSGLRVALLAAHADVDTADDLQLLPSRLRDDQRPSRRRLCDWIESEALA